MGIDTSKYFSGQYLNVESARDYVGKILVIEGVDVENMRDGTQKIKVLFEGVDEEYIPNKTSYRKIKDVFGVDSSDWIHGGIEFEIIQVMFNGKLVPSVSIKRVIKPDELKMK